MSNKVLFDKERFLIEENSSDAPYPQLKAYFDFTRMTKEEADLVHAEHQKRLNSFFARLKLFLEETNREV
jgi:hypothetical protein